MSIGNSALDYFNKKEIRKFLKTYYPRAKNFMEAKTNPQNTKLMMECNLLLKKKTKLMKFMD